MGGVRSLQRLREDEVLRGVVGGVAGSRDGRSGTIGAKLSKLKSERNGAGRRSRSKTAAFSSSDPRQRVIATVFYQGHGGGAAGRLLAHAQYLERDGAGPSGEKGQMYDRDHDDVAAHERLQAWAREDKRHFRLMLAPESGARMEDLKDLTRATMARMERDLGFDLEWVAVEHHNTDNPHVHVILRGRRREGPEFTLPRDYVGLGLRNAARDAATEMLGDRGPEDERLALERETRAARYTRLDQLLEPQIRVGVALRIQAVGRAFEPVLRAALRHRVRELAKLGLAQEVKRDRFRFEPDWTERLQEIGRGLDIRRKLGRPLSPGEGKVVLYHQKMGRIAGEVVEIGRRGDGRGKSYAIVKTERNTPVFVNLRARDIRGVQVGGILAVKPRVHKGLGVRVGADVLSAWPLDLQIGARAETELDRELARAIAGAPARLPRTASISKALDARMAWHERERTGGRDLVGRFEFSRDALKRLREEELMREAEAFARPLGKRLVGIDDGLEREWKVRGVKWLHQGRVAMLERNDAVALAPISAGQNLTPGRSYSITMAAGKVKLTPSLGLER